MSATTTIELFGGPDSRAHNAQDKDTTPFPLNVETAPAIAKVQEKGTTAVIIATITGVTMISSLLSGLITISLPAMAKDLQISDALLLW